MVFLLDYFLIKTPKNLKKAFLHFQIRYDQYLYSFKKHISRINSLIPIFQEYPLEKLGKLEISGSIYVKKAKQYEFCFIILNPRKHRILFQAINICSSLEVLIIGRIVFVGINELEIDGIKYKEIINIGRLTSLGKGSGGSVLFDKENNNAIKIYNEAFDLKNINHQTYSEILSYILFQNNPFCIKVDSFSIINGHLCLIMEYAPYCLSDILKENPDWWNSTTKTKMIFGICHFLSEVHNLGMIHRDIHPSNILFNYDHIVKMCDFGSFSLCLEDKATLIGHFDTQSPDMKYPTYTADADMYSLCYILQKSGKPSPLLDKIIYDCLNTYKKTSLSSEMMLFIVSCGHIYFDGCCLDSLDEFIENTTNLFFSEYVITDAIIYLYKIEYYEYAGEYAKVLSNEGSKDMTIIFNIMATTLPGIAKDLIQCALFPYKVFEKECNGRKLFFPTTTNTSCKEAKYWLLYHLGCFSNIYGSDFLFGIFHSYPFDAIYATAMHFYLGIGVKMNVNIALELLKQETNIQSFNALGCILAVRKEFRESDKYFELAKENWNDLKIFLNQEKIKTRIDLPLYFRTKPLPFTYPTEMADYIFFIANAKLDHCFEINTIEIVNSFKKGFPIIPNFEILEIREFQIIMEKLVSENKIDNIFCNVITGILYYYKKDYTKARVYLTKAADEQDPVAIKYLFDIIMNNPLEAYEFARKVTRMGCIYPMKFYISKLVFNLSDNKDIERCLFYSDVMVKYSPDDCFPFLINGLVYGRIKNRYVQASSYLNKAIELGSKAAYYYLAELTEPYDISESISLYQEALKSNFVESLYRLSHLYNRISDFENARIYAEKSIQYSDFAYAELGRSYCVRSKNPNRELEMKYLQQSMCLNNPDAYYYYGLSIIDDSIIDFIERGPLLILFYI